MNCDVLVRSDDKSFFTEFKFPVYISYSETLDAFKLYMGENNYCLGVYNSEESATKALEYVVYQRNHFVFDQDKLNNIIINIPTEEDINNKGDMND